MALIEKNVGVVRDVPFGSLAISCETHGFASRPHDRFAIIGEPNGQAAPRDYLFDKRIDKCPMETICQVSSLSSLAYSARNDAKYQ